MCVSACIRCLPLNFTEMGVERVFSSYKSVVLHERIIKHNFKMHLAMTICQTQFE